MSKIADETENRHLVKRLGDFGLSDKEASVYLALLPYRDIGSSKLIRATGLHGQFVYDALEKLEGLGLARHVIQNGRKKFSAQTPTRLLSILEEKKLAAQSIAKELQSRFAGKHEQNFEVYQGEEAFLAHQMDLIQRVPEGAVWNVVASEADRYLETLEKYGTLKEFDTVREEKNITIRYLGVEARRAVLAAREKNWFNWTYKVLPGLGVGTISIEMFPETVSFVVYGEPMLCFTLTSKEVADGYRQFFEALWNLSSK